jgi:hypothetical protein
MTAAEITACFDKAKNAEELNEAYGISPQRSTAAKLGALDLLDDIQFAMPCSDIAKRWRNDSKPIYQYFVDQPNPWQPSSRAHHAAGLIMLFRGHDLSIVSPDAEAVGEEMRERFIIFINGEKPWSGEKVFAFGPLGECKEIGETEYAARRRVSHWEILKWTNPAELTSVFAGIAMGRLSLDN